MYFSSYGTGSKAKEFCTWTLNTPPHLPRGHWQRPRVTPLESKPPCWGPFSSAHLCREGFQAWRGCQSLLHACTGVKCGTLARLLSRLPREEGQQHRGPCLSSVTSRLIREEAQTAGIRASEVIIHSYFLQKVPGSVLGCFCLQAIHLKSRRGNRRDTGMGVEVGVLGRHPGETDCRSQRSREVPEAFKILQENQFAVGRLAWESRGQHETSWKLRHTLQSATVAVKEVSSPWYRNTFSEYFCSNLINFLNIMTWKKRARDSIATWMCPTTLSIRGIQIVEGKNRFETSGARRYSVENQWQQS